MNNQPIPARRTDFYLYKRKHDFTFKYGVNVYVASLKFEIVSGSVFSWDPDGDLGLYSARIRA